MFLSLWTFDVSVYNNTNLYFHGKAILDAVITDALTNKGKTVQACVTSIGFDVSTPSLSHVNMFSVMLMFWNGFRAGFWGWGTRQSP